MTEKRAKSRDAGSLLGPLAEALRSGRNLRLVARPGDVQMDGAAGSAATAVRWEVDQHRAALAALTEPLDLAGGVTAVSRCGAVVLCRPPDAGRRLADLTREALVSKLAGELLSATLEVGRNVLVAGSWCAAVELVAALVAEGRRPAVAAAPEDAVPPAWLRARGLDDAMVLGADRVGVWSADAGLRVQVLTGTGGVAAWIEARRLDRALLRFEADVERNGRANAPLHVLAAIDLVVVMAGARVREVAEIQLVDEGYRPRLLFTSGLPPVPAALVPVAQPSFLNELMQAGHRVLVDELSHIATGRSEVAGARVPAPARATVAPAPEPPPVQIDPALADAPPPGWELDRLPNDAVEASGQHLGAPEDAEMAASFGLGPPPTPPGVTPMGSEGRERSTFQEALRRARERARDDGHE